LSLTVRTTDRSISCRSTVLLQLHIKPRPRHWGGAYTRRRRPSVCLSVCPSPAARYRKRRFIRATMA